MRKLLLLVLILLALSPGQIYAAAGIGITPALSEITLESDQPAASFKIGLSNSTETPVTLKLSSLDFGALNESGGIAFIGLTSQEASPFGLKQWMHFDTDTVVLNPGDSKEVQVTITNQDSLSPGGHYGAVVVSAGNNPEDGNLAVIPAASSLVLLKKTGGETLQLKLESLKADGSLIRLPSGIESRFQNTGNTHAVPRGVVELTGPFGSKIARSTINETSAYILPDSFRVIKTPLKGNGQPWLPGRYKVTATWRYDGSQQTETITSYHWYIGTITLYILGILTVILVLVLRSRARRRSSRGA